MTNSNNKAKEMKVGTKIRVTNTKYYMNVPNGSVMTVTRDCGSGHVEATVEGVDSFPWFMDSETYEVLSDDTITDGSGCVMCDIGVCDDTPKLEPKAPTLWRDMMPEEKGALLLAHHEGREVEMWTGHLWHTVTFPSYGDCVAYRIKPSSDSYAVSEPKVEVVVLENDGNGGWSFYEDSGTYKNTHRITFNTIDGKPDPASIKMEEI